ncbi:MAG: class I SAM-dependent methyltransferase [Planctomycetia bacterium]|nr:class I SAM-dependent methyltransferase [Planctomycetia bacterium]
MGPHSADIESFRHARFPEGEKGREMLERMNVSHRDLTVWCFEFVDFGQRILDVGCGGGLALETLAELFPHAELYGCDVSPLSIDIAKKRNEKHLAWRMNFKQCTVVDLIFPTGYFDTVISIESLYFWPDVLGGLKEINRVLKKGGCFMTALEMGNGPEDDNFKKLADEMKIYCPAPGELNDMMVQAGFNILSLEHDQQRGWLCAVGQK